MDYVKPYGVTTPGRPSFVNGNPAAGIKGSIPTAAVFEHPMREILAVIEAAGLTPNSGDLTQLLQAIRSLAALGVYIVQDTGTANAMVGTSDYPPGSYSDVKLLVVKKMAADNSDAVTGNFWSKGSVAINSNTGAAFASGSLKSGGVYLLTPDSGGSSFRALGGATSYTSAAALAANSGEGVSVVIPASPVTITIASPGVVTWNGHGLAAGTAVQLTTAGALPTGYSAGGVYYVVNPTTNTFQLAASVGGAAINTSGSQSGAHTATAVGAATVNQNIPGLSHDVTPANLDLWMRFKAASGHHVQMTTAELLTWLQAVIVFPNQGKGELVGQTIEQYVHLGGYAPQYYGFVANETTGTVAAASDLLAGSVAVGGYPTPIYEVPINSNAVPPVVSGYASGPWISYPNLTGTWRLVQWSLLTGWGGYYGYAFGFTWKRIA